MQLSYHPSSTSVSTQPSQHEPIHGDLSHWPYNHIFWLKQQSCGTQYYDFHFIRSTFRYTNNDNTYYSEEPIPTKYCVGFFLWISSWTIGEGRLENCSYSTEQNEYGSFKIRAVKKFSWINCLSCICILTDCVKFRLIWILPLFFILGRNHFCEQLLTLRQLLRFCKKSQNF